MQNYIIPVPILLDNMDCAIKFAKDYLEKKTISYKLDNKRSKGYPIFSIGNRRYVLIVFYYGNSLIEHPLPPTFKATPPLKKVNIHLRPM